MDTSETRFAMGARPKRDTAGRAGQGHLLPEDLLGEASSLLRARQVRLTRQRLVVLALLLAERAHGVRPESMFRLALRSNSRVSLAACRSILRELQHVGLAERYEGEDGYSRYVLKC